MWYPAPSPLLASWRVVFQHVETNHAAVLPLAPCPLSSALSPPSPPCSSSLVSTSLPPHPLQHIRLFLPPDKTIPSPTALDHASAPVGIVDLIDNATGEARVVFSVDEDDGLSDEEDDDDGGDAANETSRRRCTRARRVPASSLRLVSRRGSRDNGGAIVSTPGASPEASLAVQISVWGPAVVTVGQPFTVWLSLAPTEEARADNEEDWVGLFRFGDTAGSCGDRFYRATADRRRTGISWEPECGPLEAGTYELRYYKGAGTNRLGFVSDPIVSIKRFSNIAADEEGRCVYLHNEDGLHQIGTGLGGTDVGRLYQTGAFCAGQEGWVAGCRGQVYYQACDGKQPILQVDARTLQPLRECIIARAGQRDSVGVGGGGVVGTGSIDAPRDKGSDQISDKGPALFSDGRLLYTISNTVPPRAGRRGKGKGKGQGKGSASPRPAAGRLSVSVCEPNDGEAGLVAVRGPLYLNYGRRVGICGVSAPPRNNTSSLGDDRRALRDLGSLFVGTQTRPPFVVDTHAACTVPRSGVVVAWRVRVSRPGAVHVCVWRPAGPKGIYALVGHNVLAAGSHGHQGSEPQTISVPAGEFLQVKAGDCIGVLSGSKIMVNASGASEGGAAGRTSGACGVSGTRVERARHLHRRKGGECGGTSGANEGEQTKRMSRYCWGPGTRHMVVSVCRAPWCRESSLAIGPLSCGMATMTPCVWPCLSPCLSFPLPSSPPLSSLRAMPPPNRIIWCVRPRRITA